MTQNGTLELPKIPGTERSEAERLAAQWPHLSRNLFPEGSDCYDDRDRAAYVEASYSNITDDITNAERGQPILLVGRKYDRLSPNGFERVFALGELAGGGAGAMLDFREGQIVFPTLRYALMRRFGLTATADYSGPHVYEEPLESGKVFKWEGLLPPREDLMDRLLHAGLDTSGRKLFRSGPVDEEEIWNRSGEIAIGDEEVITLMVRTLITNGKRTRKLYSHDFSLLLEALTTVQDEAVS